MTTDKKSFCHVYGYEDYDVRRLTLSRLVTGRASYYTNVESTDYHREWYYTAPDGFLDEHSSTLFSWGRTGIESVLGDRVLSLSPGNSLYFTKQCKVPRAMFDSQYKRVLNTAKADAVVIPSFKTWSREKHCLMFINDRTRQVWIYHGAEGDDYWRLNWRQTLGVGNTVLDFFRTMNPVHYKHNLEMLKLADSPLLDATCVHAGTVFRMQSDQIPLLETFLGIHRKVVFENTLLKSLPENTPDEISVDTISNLYGLLKGGVADNVKLALKTLASLNYTGKYRSTFCMLLDMTAVNWYPYRNESCGIKEMCRSLNYTGRWESFRPRYHYTVTEEEKELFTWLYNIQIEDKIRETLEYLNSKTNMTVSLEYNVKISL